MKNCEKNQKWYIEAFYNELNEKQKRLFKDHLRKCPECSAEFSRFTATLNDMGNYIRPEPVDQYWNSYWDKLSSRIETVQAVPSSVRKWWERLIRYIFREPSRIYRPAIALTAVLFIGILIGKTFFSRPYLPQEQTSISYAPPVQPDFAQLLAERYLDRAKLVLLGIVNYDTHAVPQFKPSFERQKQISRELIDQSDLLKRQLSSAEHLRLLDLISELEVTLLQIANLEADYDLQEVEIIQSGAERKALLFKINLNEIEVTGRKARSLKYSDRKI